MSHEEALSGQVEHWPASVQGAQVGRTRSQKPVLAPASARMSSADAVIALREAVVARDAAHARVRAAADVASGRWRAVTRGGGADAADSAAVVVEAGRDGVERHRVADLRGGALRVGGAGRGARIDEDPRPRGSASPRRPARRHPVPCFRLNTRQRRGRRRGQSGGSGSWNPRHLAGRGTLVQSRPSSGHVFETTVRISNVRIVRGMIAFIRRRIDLIPRMIAFIRRRIDLIPRMIAVIPRRIDVLRAMTLIMRTIRSLTPAMIELIGGRIRILPPMTRFLPAMRRGNSGTSSLEGVKLSVDALERRFVRRVKAAGHHARHVLRYFAVPAAGARPC